MAWTGIRIRGTDHLSIFLNRKDTLELKKSRDDSRVVLLLLLLFWKEEAQYEN